MIQEQEIPIGYKLYRLSDTKQKKNNNRTVFWEGKRRLRLGLKSKTETKKNMIRKKNRNEKTLMWFLYFFVRKMQKQANCTKETKMEKRWTKPPQTQTNTQTQKHKQQQANKHTPTVTACCIERAPCQCCIKFLHIQTRRKTKRIRFNIYNWEAV